VRVLVPCYYEHLNIVENTVTAALGADLPANVRRTVYLCDDKPDPKKAEWVSRQNRADLVYVSGEAGAELDRDSLADITA
jgi:hypothetical protein